MIFLIHEEMGEEDHAWWILEAACPHALKDTDRNMGQSQTMTTHEQSMD